MEFTLDDLRNAPDGQVFGERGYETPAEVKSHDFREFCL